MLRCLFAFMLAVVPLLANHAIAQSSKDPLNEDEVEQVREFANQPNDRLKLYGKFIDQRIEAITKLASDKKAQDRVAELRARIEEFTSLVDELQDNLDTYDHDHADIRKALKSLAEASMKWEPALHLPEANPAYDFDRKSAVEAARSAVDQIQQIRNEQEKYFIEHKDQAGKNGTGPQG
ncbi:MAG: hypothetical protein IRZ03_07555 [Acidobacterium ailaaui]|jgi:predicted glycoside hydrolase/deacetylase ChbG (UPF0249 family)|nr:hypothetical protein [Pseudacidobacterium ailaaui]